MAPPGYYGNYVTYPPAAVSPAEEKKPEKKEKKTKASSPRAWQGRTKAEVDEDNMKFAAREGAYDERKIAPVGLAPDQIVWVVELDGGNTLRSVIL